MISLYKKTRGFTLIEMIVSIGLFTIVLFIASSAFLSVVNADRKSRATRLAMDNLTVALEDMTRRLKTGFSYTCGGDINSRTPGDCVTPSTQISFIDQDGNRVAYRLDTTEKRVYRDVARSDGVLLSQDIPVTAPDIIIGSLTFDVRGSNTSDDTQPYVKIFIEGETGGGVVDAKFSLQTMVTQRVYDI